MELNERLNHLYELYQEINNNIDKDTLFIYDHIKDYIKKRLKAKNFYIALYDENLKEYTLPYYFDEKEPIKKFSLEELKHGLTNYVRETQKPKRVSGSDFENLKTLYGLELVGPKAEVWIGAPIAIGEFVYGVMAIQDYENENAFNEDDLKILKNISSFLAFVLDVKSKIEKENGVKLLTQKMSEASNNINTEIDFRTRSFEYLNELKQIIEYTKATIQIIQPGYRILFAFDGFGIDQIDETLLGDVYKDKLIKKFIKKNEIYFLPNTENENDFDKTHSATYDVKSWICVPVYQKKKLIAIITLDHNQKDFYQKEKYEQIINEFQKKNKSFLVDVYEFENKQIANRDIEISRLLAQIFVEQKELKENIYNLMKEFISRNKYKNCSIFMPQYDNYQQKLVPIIACGVNEDKILTRKFVIKGGKKNGLAVKVFNTPKKILVDNPVEEADYIEVRGISTKITGLAVFPIKIKKWTLGVLCVDGELGNKFSKTDAKAINGFTKSLEAIYLNHLNAEFISNLSQRIIVNEIDEMLKQIISSALLISNFTSGSIKLIKKSGKKIKQTESFEYPVNLELPDPRLQDKDGLTRKVIDKKKYLFIANTESTEYKISEGLKQYAKSIIIIPIKIGDEVIGVISLFSKLTHNVDDNTTRLIEAICNQAAVGIMKNKMLTELKIRNNQLEVFKKIGEYVIENNNTHFFETIYEKIKPLLKSDEFIIKINPSKDNDGKALWFKNGKPDLNPETQMIEISEKITNDKMIITKNRLIGVPVLFNKEIIGVIIANNKMQNIIKVKDQKIQTNKIKQVLENIAMQIAFVIKNINLFERLQKSLEFQEKYQIIIKGDLKLNLGILKKLDKKKSQNIIDGLKLLFESNLIAYNEEGPKDEICMVNPKSSEVPIIDMNKYFGSLIGIIKNNQKVNIITGFIDKGILLRIEQAVACGQILALFVLILDTKNTNNANIEVSLTNKKDKYILCVSGETTTSDIKETYEYELISIIVNDKLGAKSKIESSWEKKYKVQIVFYTNN